MSTRLSTAPAKPMPWRATSCPWRGLFHLKFTALAVVRKVTIRPSPFRKHGEALDTLEIHVACHGGGNNPLDDQLAEPGFPEIEDPGMGSLVRVGRGGGPWPEHPGGAGGNSQAPRLVAGDARSQGLLWKSCSFPSLPVPVPHCPHPGTTPQLQSGSPDSGSGRPDSGTARSSRSRRRRQTTR